jgi:hypothetical protein
MAEEEKNLQDPSVQEATPEETSDPSPAPESGKEGATTTESGQSSQVEDKDLSVEELQKKYSASSKEARLLKEEKEREAKRAEQLQQELLSTVTKDRSTFESYLDNKGLSPEQKLYYMNVYDSEIAPKKGQANESGKATENQEQGTPSPAPQNPIREQWMSKVDQEYQAKFEAQRQAAEEFFGSPENVELAPEEKKAIIAQAEMLDTKYGYSPQEALATARKRVLSPEEIKNEGYVDGIRDSLVGGVQRGVSGASPKKGSAFTLPKKHQKFVDGEIKRKGLTGKAADEYREAYALKLARDSD